MNMLNDGLTWLEQKLNKHCSGQVEYVRDGQEAITIDAVFGKTEFEVTGEDGFASGCHIWDFLIDAELLGFEPKTGDVIKLGGKEYELMKLPGEGCWRWTGPNRHTYRIHTKGV